MFVYTDVVFLFIQLTILTNATTIRCHIEPYLKLCVHMTLNKKGSDGTWFGII